MSADREQGACGPVEALMRAPIKGEPIGRDPRHSEAFLVARREVQKLADNDFARIRDAVLDALRTEGKDLRLLGYLALAEARLAGLESVTDVLHGMAWLLENAADSVYPTRLHARRQAIEWLDNDRLLAFISARATAEAGPTRQQLSTAILRLRDAARDSIGDAAFAVAPRILRCLESTTRLEAATASQNADDARMAPAQASPRKSAGVDSDASMQRSVRQILTYLRSERRWSELIRLSRALRWGTLSAPPLTQGKARIDPPRLSAINAIAAARQSEDWDAMLLASENAFLEPGGQFSFALQRSSFDAAVAMGNDDAASGIRALTVEVLSRLPTLTASHFSDGSPFVVADVQEWLDSLGTSSPRAPSASAVTNHQTGSEWSRHLNEARTASERLPDRLRYLDGLATIGLDGYARRHLAKARLCIEHDRPEFAFHLLEELLDLLHRRAGVEWVPEIALEAGELLSHVLVIGDTRLGLTPDYLRERMSALRALACRIDIAHVAERH